MRHVGMALGLSVMGMAPAEWPAPEVPTGLKLLAPGGRGQTVVAADFDGDGKRDLAGLFAFPAARAVQLRLLTGTGRHVVLEVLQADSRALSSSLRVRHDGGDESCPLEDCGRSYVAFHEPALVVTLKDGRQHLWQWTGQAYTRFEVYP